MKLLKALGWILIITIGTALGHVLGVTLLAIWQMTYGMEVMTWILNAL